MIVIHLSHLQVVFEVPSSFFLSSSKSLRLITVNINWEFLSQFSFEIWDVLCFQFEVFNQSWFSVSKFIAVFTANFYDLFSLIHVLFLIRVVEFRLSLKFIVFNHYFSFLNTLLKFFVSSIELFHYHLRNHKSFFKLLHWYRINVLQYASIWKPILWTLRSSLSWLHAEETFSCLSRFLTIECIP